MSLQRCFDKRETRQKNLRHGICDVRNVHHGLGPQLVAVVDLKVVPVGPLATRTVAVVGVVDRGEVPPCRPLKVVHGVHVGHVWELPDGKLTERIINSGVWLVEVGPGGGGHRGECRYDDCGPHFES